MNAREAGIARDPAVEGVLRAVEKASRGKARYVLLVNTRDRYAAEGALPVKPIGNVAAQRMTDILCDCGCRLLTDGDVFWCSGIKCNFYGIEETF